MLYYSLSGFALTPLEPLRRFLCYNLDTRASTRQTGGNTIERKLIVDVKVSN